MAFTEVHEFEAECDFCHKPGSQPASSLEDAIKRLVEKGWVVLGKPHPYSDLDCLCLCPECILYVRRSILPGVHDVEEFYKEGGTSE